MRLPLAAILALVAAPAFAAEAPLDRLIRFRDPQFCAPARDFGRLLDSLLIARGEGFDLGAPQVPQAYRRQLGVARIEVRPDRLHVATLPIRGSWRGLKVRELYSYATPDTDNLGFGIRFAASPAKGRAAANAAGLKIPPTGRRVDRSELDTVIEVKRAPDGAELTCGT